MNIVKIIENNQIDVKNFEFRTGDKISVNFKILDTNIRKKQYNFEGYIIAIKGTGINTTCTLRKSSFGENVEKTFFINSPLVNSFTLIKKGNKKQAKLYYMKDKL